MKSYKNFTKKLIVSLSFLMLVALTPALRSFVLRQLPISSKYFGPPGKTILGKDFAGRDDITLLDYHKYQKESYVYNKLDPKDPQSYHLHVGMNNRILDEVEEYVLVINDGRVYGRNTSVFTKKDEVIRETVHHPLSFKYLYHKLKFPKVKKTDEVIVALGQCHPTNYYHWVSDVLAKLELLEKANIHWDKIYIPYRGHPYQKECLEKLNLDPSKLIYSNNHTHIQAKKLIVPVVCYYKKNEDQIIDVSHNFERISKYFKKKFCLNDETPSTKRIYIARNPSLARGNFRKILNEDEFWPLLQAHGFEKHYLEDYTVQQQAELFSQAEAVVAYHGAGLTNLIFSKPGTKVFEIFHKEYFKPFYFNLCGWCDLEHFFTLAYSEKTDKKSCYNGYVKKEQILEFLEKLPSHDFSGNCCKL